jgi:predicted metalloendopeptidase
VRTTAERERFARIVAVPRLCVGVVLQRAAVVLCCARFFRNEDAALKTRVLPLFAAGILSACAATAPQHKAPQQAPPPAQAEPGVDPARFDTAVRPQDDFYRYINGKWLDSTQIPADHASWTAFAEVDDAARASLRGLIEKAQTSPQRQTDADVRKIGDLYSSFMDKAQLDKLGMKPLQEEFARIDAIKSKHEIPALLAHFQKIGVSEPFVQYVDQDDRDSTRYAVYFYQHGLGLPDRDYYLKLKDPRFKEILQKYQVYIADMFKLAGDKSPERKARAIVALETRLARAEWTRVDNRDAEKLYNKYTVAQLGKLTKGYGWKPYLSDAGIADKVSYVIVNQPSYFKALATELKTTSLPVWKAYFKWHLLADYAPYLSKPFVDRSFAFNGTVVRGVPENEPRWKRGVSLVDQSIGEGLGKLYVAEYFPPESKARMEQLVGNLLAAYKQSIESLDWMGPDTKKMALEKLSKLTTKIGYPNKWRDYSKLSIKPDDLVGNVMRAQSFEYWRNVDKLGKPIDREEWEMTPQTVNAYYKQEMNEIVFPAAILQPPFFNPKADDAVNYGGIGAVIGHEISHAFDDQGSKYDGDGNLHNWWTAADHERFAAKTKTLVAQYSAYEPVPGYHVNGQLTLGENIADNSGLAIAHKAYILSLHGQPAPVIDGLGGDQRFYAGWTQGWRGKVREAEEVRRIKTDPHSPPQVRGSAPLRNQDAFYSAYDVKAGDKMYLPPDRRVSIW